MMLSNFSKTTNFSRASSASKSCKASGFTLVELLLSIVFGLIVLAGVIYIYVAVVVSSTATMKSSKLNTQLMTIMTVMTNDIRRAGYWSNVSNLASANPFNQIDDTVVQIFKADNSKITENTDDDGVCILYAYDKDEDGVVDIDEYFGFKVLAEIVYMRTAVTGTADTCATAADWTELSEPRIYKIDTLTFNPNDSACVNSNEPDGVEDGGDAAVVDDDDERDCYLTAPNTADVTVETREIEINMSGYLADDPFVTFNITQNIRVRNDLVRVR